MPISQEDAAIYRDRLHNLDVTNPEYLEFWKQQFRLFCIGNEKNIRHAYSDKDRDAKPIKPGVKVEGNVTIGIGFNMSRNGAEKEWHRAFGGTVNFESAKSGRIKLTEDQVNTLFWSNVETRLDGLKKIYRSNWDKFRANEQMALLDIYFNGPGLMKEGSNFRRHVLDYAETGDPKHLRKALWELEYRSNRDKLPGLQRRREVQVALLDSTRVPIYTKPGEPPLPAFASITVTPGKTIIPRGMYEHYGAHSDKRYYVWRTQMDSKVRESHAVLEGRVFSIEDPSSIGHPGEDSHCRCTAEPLPVIVQVIEETLEVKYMRLTSLELGCMIADWRRLQADMMQMML